MLAYPAVALLLAATTAFGQSGGAGSSDATAEEDTKPIASYLFPPNRGTHSLVATVSPCQGWALGLRQPYPLSGGVISYATQKDYKNAQIRYSTSADPQSQDDFSVAIANVSDSAAGQRCIPGPDFGALGLSAGDVVTMQLYYTSGPKNTEFYECADLTLVSASAFTDGNWDTQCLNRMDRTQTKKVSASNPGLYKLQQEQAAETEASGDDAGLTKVESGVVGAMVSLAVVLGALGLAYLVGVVAFGKGAKRAKKADGGERQGSFVDHADAKTVNSV